MHKYLKLSLLVILCIVSSCKTYLIPVESFKAQFSGIDSTSLKMVSIQGAFNATYWANPIATIQCIDKAGNPVTLNNHPALEIRFTHGENNTKTIFYFDRVIKENDMIIGGQSRIIPSLTKSIPFQSISTIEIQNGGKRMEYVNKKPK